ncbi:MAG: hypothetical protein PVJ26_10320 [Anaerolineae bacterium]|jgi:hypothetical protein
MSNEQRSFRWQRHPDAEAFVLARVDEFLAVMPPASTLAAALRARTSSRLVDWLDHLILADSDSIQGQLRELGFEQEDVPVEPNHRVYHHPGTILPRIVVSDQAQADPAAPLATAIQVEDISHFLMTHHLAVPIEGSLVSPYRRSVAWQQDGRRVLVVERRGHAGFVPAEMPPDYAQQYLRAFERWATRSRLFDDDLAGMEAALALARSLVSDMGTDTAAWIAFEAERAHWQRRNRAGQVQKARQDQLGMGWANHDHHTFRSSRRAFPLLVEILETFGFHSRERFYAGAEAGWGAQVMEQPTCRFAVFADVDLSPDEVEGDFAHQPLAPRQELGTVGLWCALHGDSMLSAGLHHLASRFEFDKATQDLDGWGIEMMRPFSDFPYLRQAFTRGERWDVASSRLERLAAAGQIDEEQRAAFEEKGAIGSHLENIQRGDGFKGFNQQQVSDIIRRTDPRSDL